MQLHGGMSFHLLPCSLLQQDLHCKLSGLTDHNALSYTRDALTNLGRMQVQNLGETDQRTLVITQGLLEAVRCHRRFGLFEDPRPLWVDHVAIDQTNA